MYFFVLLSVFGCQKNIVCRKDSQRAFRVKESRLAQQQRAQHDPARRERFFYRKVNFLKMNCMNVFVWTLTFCMYFILSGNLILRLSQEIREVAYDRQKKCLQREEK
jgi:hypothetical protein